MELITNDRNKECYSIALYFVDAGYISKDFSGDLIAGFCLKEFLHVKKDSFVCISAKGAELIIETYYNSKISKNKIHQIMVDTDVDMNELPEGGTYLLHKYFYGLSLARKM